MNRSIVGVVVAAWLGLGLVASGPIPTRAGADDPSPKVEARDRADEADKLGLGASQVTLAIEKGRTRRQFRATALARKDDVLTVLTAAHCLSEEDEAGPAILVVGGEALEGTVLSVVRNPAYQPLGRNEVPGPDNAVVRLRFRAGNKPAAGAFEAIRPASAVVPRPYPDPSGRFASVRMFDKKGVEHQVRASNHSNPRLLVWGPSYTPSPGDSGGGVFYVREGAEGKPEAFLIGVIVAHDARGGNASLVSREMGWLAEALPAE